MKRDEQCLPGVEKGVLEHRGTRHVVGHVFGSIVHHGGHLNMSRSRSRGGCKTVQCGAMQTKERTSTEKKTSDTFAEEEKVEKSWKERK